MAIHYGFYETNGIAAEEKKTFARAKIRDRKGIKDLAKGIEQGTTASRADIVLVLSALVREMQFAMLDGNSVELEGLGTFSISLGGEVRPDKNGKPMLHDACVRGINFRPCREFLRGFSGASFTSRYTYVGRSEPLTEEEVRERVTAMLTKHGLMTFEALRYRLGLTRDTCRRRMKPMIDDGTICRIGTRAKAFYCLSVNAEEQQKKFW